MITLLEVGGELRKKQLEIVEKMRALVLLKKINLLKMRIQNENFERNDVSDDDYCIKNLKSLWLNLKKEVPKNVELMRGII